MTLLFKINAYLGWMGVLPIHSYPFSFLFHPEWIQDVFRGDLRSS
nr:MAG TPA: hypothetical protein [Caudoviricetes sp.]